MARFYRSDQASINVTVGGIALDTASWDSMEGGEPVAESVDVYPGGMAPQVALGGLPKWSQLTITRLWSDVLIGQFKALSSVAGFAPVTASYVVLEPNKTPSGTTITYTGVLTSVMRPGYKASESKDAYLQITCSVNGQVS